jgi:hypothetical protein
MFVKHGGKRAENGAEIDKARAKIPVITGIMRNRSQPAARTGSHFFANVNIDDGRDPVLKQSDWDAIVLSA